ncbi:alpha-amylase [candidate division GN15 bacterium]|uniref:Alpha-amylase n=1 Tax=candidate division GN15 bacterium TaxID=2072418 RepID=A0A855X3N8_9BACT|nr:MAG: alpha-amylase [candidate division GN15 bacterium]
MQFGSATVSETPISFVRLFPPVPVLHGNQTATDYVNDSRNVPLSYDRLVREILLLYIASTNPAFKPYQVLFDDTDLRTEAPYVPMVNGLESFFASQPKFAPVGMTLLECLYAPIRAYPTSLRDQVNYIRTRWAHFLPQELLERAQLALDVLEEEWAMRGFGPGAIEPLRFDRDTHRRYLGYSEYAAFSEDADWMSNTILIAKSIYVWLFQLSRKYQRDIHLLSDIPDEELDRLAGWGITGLWLIGLWERSSASRRIKQIMGNPEAASSAYSLYDYVIAGDLGGEEAFKQLKWRAWQRGIRLASDMVPNHMGIYSRWMVEHPQWFLQTDYPPYPAYQYTGVDLSEDPRVCLQIEDGYWQHRDAAVVLKRIDKWTGDTKYIYHGNDGTNMPWNDTAQLNFLIPEVREAVIQMILHVARKFPIIRFDAAMTLAKRHFQRLWFPQPGEGGAIPSRAEHGMTREQFDQVMPKEFWREVVDRVAQEVPDTLLLAEAFWLMEGYFVRTLGMHRVYNSAFMNMLKMEDNANYRTTIKNVLEFSPEVLKRFVNFMNNPDERTAVEQFGKGDKYYGVAMMMVTMPGLPMFGHGQIEGFSEKYGMEYRRSYWDEQVDEGMVHRHETDIFPLMRRRRIFSGAANFALYDFITPEGWVDENVFAYSNRVGGERALILYNNAFNTTRGTIHMSTAINIGEGTEINLVRRSLGEALELEASDNSFYGFRDYRSRLEFIRSGRGLVGQGLFAELQGYQYHAFLDFRHIRDTDGSWRELERRLAGSGVANLDEAHREMQAEPILGPYRQVMNIVNVQEVLINRAKVHDRIESTVRSFYHSVGQATHTTALVDALLARFMKQLRLMDAGHPTEAAKAKPRRRKVEEPSWMQVSASQLDHVAFAWLTLQPLGELRTKEDPAPPAALAVSRVDQWLLLKAVREAFNDWLSNPDTGYWDSRLVLILLGHSDLLTPARGRSLGELFRQALSDTTVRDYLHINTFNNVVWLNKDRLERMTAALLIAARLTVKAGRVASKPTLDRARKNAALIIDAAEQAGYRVEEMLRLLN